MSWLNMPGVVVGETPAPPPVVNPIELVKVIESHHINKSGKITTSTANKLAIYKLNGVATITTVSRVYQPSDTRNACSDTYVETGTIPNSTLYTYTPDQSKNMTYPYGYVYLTINSSIDIDAFITDYTLVE